MTFFTTEEEGYFFVLMPTVGLRTKSHKMKANSLAQPDLIPVHRA